MLCLRFFNFNVQVFCNDDSYTMMIPDDADSIAMMIFDLSFPYAIFFNLCRASFVQYFFLVVIIFSSFYRKRQKHRIWFGSYNHSLDYFAKAQTL